MTWWRCLCGLFLWVVPPAFAASGGMGLGDYLTKQEYHRCPIGFYRSQPFVFTCQNNSNQATLLVNPFENRTVVGIPKGVMKLAVAIESDADVDLIIYDPVEKRAVIHGSRVKDGFCVKRQYRWEDNDGCVYEMPRHQDPGFRDDCSPLIPRSAACRGHYDKMKISYSGYDKASKGLAPGEGPTHEKVEFQDTTPRPLEIRVVSNSPQRVLVRFHFKMDGVQSDACSTSSTTAPVGCEKYNRRATRDTMAAWSLHLRRKYIGSGYMADGRFMEDVDVAWKNETGSSNLYLDWWREMFDRWEAKKAYPARGAETFFFADRDNSGFVDRAEWNFVFALGKSVELVTECAANWRAKFKLDSGKAWDTFAQGKTSISKKKWDESAGQTPMMVACYSNAGVDDAIQVLPADATDIFAFVDLNQDIAIDQNEFRIAWSIANECPTMSYRDSSLIFHCSGQRGEEKVLMRARETDTIFVVPPGVKQLEVNVTSDEADIDVYLLDAEKKKWILRFGRGEIISRDSPHAPGFPPAYKQGVYEGAEMIWSGDDKQLPVTEGIRWVQSTGHSPLKLEVNNFAFKDTDATVSYRYLGVDQCPDRPLGCAIYDVQAAREAVRRWSCWANKQCQCSAGLGKYQTSEEAWDQLIINRGLISSSHAGVVEFHTWDGAWRIWPTHHTDGGSWTQAFKYIDTDNNQAVTFNEFAVAFKLCSTAADVKNFCKERVKTAHISAERAWAQEANAARSMALQQFTNSLWQTWQPPTDLKTTDGEAFQFLDTDNDETIQRYEFYACYRGFEHTGQELAQILPLASPLEGRRPPATDAVVWVFVALLMVGAGFLALSLSLFVLKRKRRREVPASTEVNELDSLMGPLGENQVDI